VSEPGPRQGVARDVASLTERDVAGDPLGQFAIWFREALEAGVRAPEAVALATASADGVPSVRMVLMKSYDERGFVFFTNYGSRKGMELRSNPEAALLFHWEALGRQVRIEGGTHRIASEESETYARSRPRQSQLSALASPQSRVVGNREVLERRVSELAARYEGAELPLPEAWGGFRLSPRSYEFWQHRASRLHDRIRYSRSPDGAWRIERLAP
jgi:pyridoxamine 5'-phosphate oxidase